MTSTQGYDEAFLGVVVSVPTAIEEITSDVATVDGDPELRYTHYSLSMSRDRKLARWVAWNIDGMTLLDGDAISREGLRFKEDPRLPGGQLLDDLYRRNNLDRGHIARRADLLWGGREAAEVANADSFFFTNIAPQMNNFNQSGKAGLWGRLENALLAQAELDRARVSVMGGPVFASDDPIYNDVAIPLSFFKTLIYRMDNEIRAKTFLLEQSLTGIDATGLAEFDVYQIPLHQLATMTSLNFPNILDTEGIEGRDVTRTAVRHESEVSW